MKKENLFLKASKVAFVFLVVLLFGCGSKTSVTPLRLHDSDGNSFDTSEWCKQKASVMIFLSPECPLCQNYTLTIRNLQSAFEKKGVVFYGVVPDKRFSNREVNAFKKTYQLNIRMLRDDEKKLTHLLKAKVTPEAFLIDTKGAVRYSGRIDNWMYEVGKKRTVITEHDLEYAINALLQNHTFKTHHAKAIGCFIE